MALSLLFLKIMNFRGKVFILILLSFALLQSCGSSGNSIVGRNQSSGDFSGGQSSTCSAGVSAIGQVSGVGTYESFNSQVQGLVSATLDPQSLGAVPLINGIDLILKLPASFKNQGTVSSGSLSLEIKDSYTGQKDQSGQIIPAYPVYLNQVSSARRYGSKYEVNFTDSYGSISVTFEESNGQIIGSISYSNSRHILGHSPASGNLGNFKIASCAVFQ